ncbi:MAG: hypothetical protein PHG14_06400 [Desulfobacter postgatei]|nr:hypothetical protein [Desulfobacter postgatei]MDD4273344.1 hypothetical protein [Desulfobacter postgatei]
MARPHFLIFYFFGECMYIQAAYMIPDEKVREREFSNLLAISR